MLAPIIPPTPRRDWESAKVVMCRLGGLDSFARTVADWTSGAVIAQSGGRAESTSVPSNIPRAVEDEVQTGRDVVSGHFDTFESPGDSFRFDEVLRADRPSGALNRCPSGSHAPVECLHLGRDRPALAMQLGIVARPRPTLTCGVDRMSGDFLVTLVDVAPSLLVARP
jgi:hypothetical protein